MATTLRAHAAHATWRDYLELTKPKVVVLMLITSLVGMFLATRAGVPWTVLIFGNLGIALCAGGAAAVNHVVDRRIDAVMARTHKRPLAEGRVSPAAALTFALVLAVQAGGGATDGQREILDLRPTALHQRVPFVFGSRAKVDRVAAHFQGKV